VRLLLVSAVMHIAGDKVWWLPRWLDRILPDVDVEGASLERAAAAHEAETRDGGEPAGSDGTERTADDRDDDRDAVAVR
jgi:RND superfamily putative drug exporter